MRKLSDEDFAAIERRLFGELDDAIREIKEGRPMAAEIKNLTGVVRSIAAVRARVARSVESLNGAVAEVEQAAGIADEFSSQLTKEAAELRAALGVETNAPPKD